MVEIDVNEIIGKLKSSDWQIRLNAARSLGYLGGESAVEPLLGLLNDGYWQIRRAAVESLGNIGDSRAVKPLIEKMSDEDWRIRQGAAFALGYLGDNSCKCHLLACLKDQEHWHVRQACAAALKYFPGSDAVKALIGALNDKEWHVRCQAAETLGLMGDSSVLEHLKKILEKADDRAKITIRQSIEQLETGIKPGDILCFGPHSRQELSPDEKRVFRCNGFCVNC